MTGTYRLAECVVEITSEHEAVHKMCAPYRAAAAPDFAVCSSPGALAAARAPAARAARAEGRPVRPWSEAYLETLVIYRAIAERMPFYDTLLFHGSAIAVDGETYLFLAKSGTGKSTHARLWRERFGDRAVMINDDKPLLRVADAGATVYGTPWDGKHHLSRNASAPLKALCILERAADNRIRRIDAAEALPFLLRQCYRPADPAATVRTLALLDALVRHVPIYRLGCNTDPDAARVAYEGMQEG